MHGVVSEKAREFKSQPNQTKKIKKIKYVIVLFYLVCGMFAFPFICLERFVCVCVFLNFAFITWTVRVAEKMDGRWRLLRWYGTGRLLIPDHSIN